MNGARSSERFETVIIGGGQAGLAVGYHLARRERPFVILEANERIGDSWRGRWDSLRLFTPRYNGLPGMSFSAPVRSYPTKDEVADYIEAYAARFHLPVRTGVLVDRVCREGDRYVVTSGDRIFEADDVVVATGPYQTPRVPDFSVEIDRGIVQLHTSEYRNPSQLAGGGVLVVGAGNSGAEIALEASSTHPTWLSGRDTGQEAPFRVGSLADRLFTPPFWFLVTYVFTTKTSVGRKLRRMGRTKGQPLVRVKRKDISAAGIERVPRVVGVRNGSPVLADRRVLDVANVIWCTGFRPDFGWIDLPVFDEDGEPVHDRGVVDSQPGFYLVGRFYLYSLTSSLLGGVGRDAEHIAKHIASRRPKGRPAKEGVTGLSSDSSSDLRARSSG
jgi:putative flavoprotein involved in K+ transport